MDSIKNIYRIGRGPSSSHTMAPMRAAQMFLEKSGRHASRYEVELYGSLASTGKGHLTDVAILDVLSPVAPSEIIWHPDTNLPMHPNGMIFKAYDGDGNVAVSWTVYSTGAAPWLMIPGTNAGRRIFMRWIGSAIFTGGAAIRGVLIGNM